MKPQYSKTTTITTATFLLVLISTINVIVNNVIVVQADQNADCWGAQLHQPSLYTWCVEWGCNTASAYREECRKGGYGARRRNLRSSSGPNSSSDDMDEQQQSSLLRLPESLQLTEIEPSDLSEECLNQEYELSVIIMKGHLILTALPVETSSGSNDDDESLSSSPTEASCPLLSAHSDFRNDQKGDDDSPSPTKRLVIMGSDHVRHAHNDGYHLANLKLKKFVTAYTNAIVTFNEDDSDDEDEGKQQQQQHYYYYDIVKNNCAIFGQSMIHLLNIDLTMDIKEYVVNAIVESASDTLLTKMEISSTTTTTPLYYHVGHLLRRLVVSSADYAKRQLVDTIVTNSIETFQNQMNKA